jgi:2,4-dichlorophenol 6-monooxygenase
VTHYGVVQPLQSLISPSTFTLLHGPDSSVLAGHTQINQLTFGVDFQDEDSWQNQTGLPDNGAVLIRPDGHIAARFDQVDEDRFMTAVKQILGRG